MRERIAKIIKDEATSGYLADWEGSSSLLTKEQQDDYFDGLGELILKEIIEGLTVIDDEDILVNACANCTREGVWSDEDCKYCQMNMRVSARTQYDHIIKQIKDSNIASESKPTIVCLCGSTRFVDTFNEWRKRLTYENKIVLSIEIVTSQSMQTDPQHVNQELKEMLDELHLRKIDLADEIMILNVGGYIGESTRKEINYAESKGKLIEYLEQIKEG